MPTLAVIDGIRIEMFYNDHEPAHFHASRGEDSITVTIADLAVYEGEAPPAMVRKVLDWAAAHQRDLALCWVHCRSGRKPGRIAE
ncbi:MAG: DUF4160 domain-containing protein [Rhodospirillaceae bacterium]